MEPQRPAAQSGPVDMDAALDAVGGDGELLQIVIGAFLEESPKLLEDISEAIGQNDPRRLQIAAHALKGTVRYYGSTLAYDLSYALETAGSSGTLDKAPETFSRLEGEIAVLRRALAPLIVSSVSEQKSP